MRACRAGGEVARCVPLLDAARAAGVHLDKFAYAQAIDACEEAGDAEIRSCQKALVESTIDLYASVCKELKPVPSKPHYVFNLRDAAKVVQGVLMVEAARLPSKEGLMRLWVHEASRVFSDRLTTDDDRAWLDESLTDLCRVRWKAKSDAVDAATNQISQSRSVEVQVYQGNGNTVIWNSGWRSVDLAHGADYVTAFPRWRPPEAGIVAGAGDAVRRGNELYWFGRGAAPSVYILDLDENRWTNTVESMAPGSAAVAWSEDDAVMLLPSGVWLRVTADGEHLTGSDAGGTITWTNLGDVTNFPECASVRLTSLGVDSSRALLWCRSDANFTTDQLQTYELSEPVNPNVEWTAAAIVTAPLLIVDEHFQVARLGASDDYRVVPGAGNNVQVLGGRLVPNGFVPAWSAPLAGTGDNLNLSSGASVVGTGDTSYLVLSGGNDAWRAKRRSLPKGPGSSYPRSPPRWRRCSDSGCHLYRPAGRSKLAQSRWGRGVRRAPGRCSPHRGRPGSHPKRRDAPPESAHRRSGAAQ